MIRKLDHTDNVNEVLHGVFKSLRVRVRVRRAPKLNFQRSLKWFVDNYNYAPPTRIKEE